jgi:hypothetical protein
MLDPNEGLLTTGFAVWAIVAGFVALWITRNMIHRWKKSRF